MFCRARILTAGVAAGLSLGWFGCQSRDKSQPLPPRETPIARAPVQTENLQKIFLDEMPKVFSLAAQENVTLHVTGNLPSGAYKFDHTQVEVRGRVIEITPWAQYDPNVMAIQMLIPFTDSVAVGPLAPGKYEIRFQERSGVQAATLEVQ